MWFRFFIIMLFLFTAYILQTSFLPYFTILGAVPDLVFVIFFLVIFFEPERVYSQGLFTAPVAGLFLDMASNSYFGIYILSLLIIYFLNKVMHHFLREDRHIHLIFYFVGVFFVSFVAYQGLLYASSLIFNFEFNVNVVLMRFWYGLIVASIGFYIFKKLFYYSLDNQLKLL